MLRRQPRGRCWPLAALTPRAAQRPPARFPTEKRNHAQNFSGAAGWQSPRGGCSCQHLSTPQAWPRGEALSCSAARSGCTGARRAGAAARSRGARAAAAAQKTSGRPVRADGLKAEARRYIQSRRVKCKTATENPPVATWAAWRASGASLCPF